MCSGAIVLARIERLVFGAADPKAGACGSLRNVVQDPRLNHRVGIVSGLLEGEISALMKTFFQNLRADKRNQKQDEGNRTARSSDS
jgi:tRNA(adenine34) deaminase